MESSMKQSQRYTPFWSVPLWRFTEKKSLRKKKKYLLVSELVEDHGLVWWLQLIQKVCFAKLIRKTDLTIKLNSYQQNCNASQCDEKLPMNIWSCKSSCFEVQAFSRLTHQSKARHAIILSFRFQTYHYPRFERISQSWKNFHKKCEYLPRASMNFHFLSVTPFLEPKEDRKR